MPLRGLQTARPGDAVRAAGGQQCCFPGSNPEVYKAMKTEKINLTEKFSHFAEHWSPKIVGEVNDSYVKLVKFKGEFIWHHHEAEDEMFLVVKGRLCIRFRDGDLWMGPGEFCIVPRGVEHMPVAEEEVHVVLFEPRSTLNTGNVRNQRTLEQLERV
jgi:mannose-6-phosphate isomerase-like protein (cupin superfamily)